MFNRIIERILDNYFANKTAVICANRLVWKYGLDIIIESRHGYIYLLAKPRKYNDDFYKEIFIIAKPEAIKSLFNIESLIKEVEELINEYNQKGWESK